MRENMPGQGYPQGVGSVKDGKVSAQADWVDRGPRVLKYRTKGVFSDRVFTVETFDSVSSYKLGIMQDLRTKGHDQHYDEDDVKTSVARLRGEEVYRPLAEGQAGTPRRRYADALRSFFATRIEQLTERDRWHIDSIMTGQSLREAAAELGIAFQNIDKGRKRAIKHLVALIGKHETDIANELIFFLKSEGGVALAGRLPDRVLAKSTVWRGHE